MAEVFIEYGGAGWSEFVERTILELGPPGRRDFLDSSRSVAESFRLGQPEAAMEKFYSLCDHSLNPEPILDLLETHAAARYLSNEGNPGRAQVEQLLVQKPEARWADALMILGAPKRALAFYAEQEPSLRSANALGLVAALLGEHRVSARALRDALDLPGYGEMEKVPVRYNLGQQLFWMAHLYESLAEFRRCRAHYPHYRRVLKWIAGLKAIINLPSGPGTGAMSMPAPYYSQVKAVAEGAG